MGMACSLTMLLRLWFHPSDAQAVSLSVCPSEEMIQQAFFHNMPLAFATAQEVPVNYYIPLNRQLQSLLYWWTPDTKFTLDNPSQVIFPPNSPSEYANQIFKTQRENVDLTNWAAAGPQAPCSCPCSCVKSSTLARRLVWKPLQIGRWRLQGTSLSPTTSFLRFWCSTSPPRLLIPGRRLATG